MLFRSKPEQVFAALEVEGIEDIALEHIPTLQGMFSALKNGEATIEEMFDPRRAGAARTFDVVQNPLRDEQPASSSDAAVSGTEEERGAQGTGERKEDAARSGDPAAVAEPDAELIAAHERGKADKAKGVQRRAIPGEYRESAPLTAAWQAGFDGAPLPTSAGLL